MKTDDWLLAAVVIGALLWPQWKGLLPDKIVPGPAPAPVVAPSAEFQAAVAPVKTVLAGKPEAQRKFGTYFRLLGVAMQQAPEAFRTVGALNQHQMQAGAIYTKQIPGGVPGLGEAVAQAYLTMLGDEDKALEPARAQQAVAALEWACQ